MPETNERSVQKRRAAVLGAGVSGSAASELLLEHGYEVKVFSQSAPAEAMDDIVIEEAADSLAKKVVKFAPDLVVVSPGIPEYSPLIGIPESAGIEVIGEVQLAWNMSHGSKNENTAPPWLCVTGTNGKTTTVGMIASILGAAGYRAPEVGNIGYPIAQAVREPADVLCVELSSFQLATSPRLSPTTAICLNLDSDHIDWHGSREKYAAAKSRIYNHVSGNRIYFADQPATEDMARGAMDSDGSALVQLVFGRVPAGAVGVEGGKIVDRAFTGDPDQPAILVKLDEVPLFKHVDMSDPSADPLVRDALAAAAVARSYGVKAQAVAQGLEQFTPQGHRRAPVPTNDDVLWIDDSKATNVHAALAAAKAIRPGSLVWILGGDAKGQDLAPLFELAETQAKALVLVGAETKPIEALAARLASRVPVTVVDGGRDGILAMRDAVRASAEIASPGDTVLLAPGCASWDQFNSYGERGDAFVAAVRECGLAEGA